jgi:hypothetical protein
MSPSKPEMNPWKRSVAAILLALAGLGDAACASSLPSSPSLSAAPGTIAGIYVLQDQDGSHVSPQRDAVVGAYPDAFLPGIFQTPPPSPLAIATTGTDGRFVITGLAPGRYFLVPTSPAYTVRGQWAELAAGKGATVTLEACRDCPAVQ